MLQHLLHDTGKGIVTGEVYQQQRKYADADIVLEDVNNSRQCQ